MKDPIPLGDRVLVSRAGGGETSPGGLIIPEAAREKAQQGMVVGVPNPNNTGVLVGQQVIFAKYGGQELNVNGRAVVLLNASELFCILPK